MDSIIHELGRHRAEKYLCDKYLRDGIVGRLLAVGLVLILAIQVSACNGGGGGSGGGQGDVQQAPQDYSGSGSRGSAPAPAPYVPPPPVTTAAAVLPDTGCDAKWPRRVRPNAQTAGELKYVDLIIACVNDSTGSLSLTNNSDMVWVFQSTPPVTLSQEKAAPEVTAFHEMAVATRLYAYSFMAPTETISVSSPPSTFEWVINPDLSLAWTLQSFALKQVEKKAVAAARTYLTSGSPVRQAIWDCSKAVYDASMKVPKVLSSQYDPAELLKEGLGMTKSSVTCAQSWKTAAQRAAEAATPMPPYAQLTTEAETALKGGGELAQKSTGLLEGLAATATKFCKFSSRC
ncbi:hypothetical protein [Arthrobacter sp. NicSoilC5]|uniref:hypothetical protein n=1 Tax=Arthrobacter sp. NicSoilC5 TaxID=2831000 RepID=UPI001CC4DAD9|nr:hypothetical protein [Arthrobacter sp. NicSoilC5]BCW78871.1 hypothetical protein NicSoilC5_08900 [Arthrobacter sp. NicSoilC5]